MITMTLKQAAKEIDRIPQSVQNWAKRLKIKITNGEISAADVDKIKAAMAKSPHSQRYKKRKAPKRAKAKATRKKVPAAAMKPRPVTRKRSLVDYLQGSHALVPLSGAQVAVLKLNGHKPEEWARDVLDREILAMVNA